MAFCAWLSEKTGETFTLPNEAEWEYACRAGAATPLWYGNADADFAAYANLADASLLHIDTYAPWALPSGAIPPWRPAAENVNDGFRVSAPIGSFQPNPWGLYDMHGNVAEWTATAYRPYPYNSADGRISPDATGKKVVRGGSWYDRPKCAGSGYRVAYAPWQPVFNVGFRVACVVYSLP
jgi:formylglycine-generating enzyme required for sulfatase activity